VVVGSSSRPTWAVLLTTHGRRDTTLASLEHLARQEGTPVTLRVVLVDAGSRDGTADAVEAAHPDALVVRAGPDLFWNAGMRRAWQEARARIGPDAVLWLNDDTLLDPDAVARLADVAGQVAAATGPAVVVGATRDPVDGTVTYSGVRRGDPRRPLAFSRVEPGTEPLEVETMNGNCVLVPAAVERRVGILDPAFGHGMGDFDYGLRARRAGVRVVLAPGTVGTCRANEPTEPSGARAALRQLRDAKGLPPREWCTFARRWAGPLWFVYAASPYVRRVVRASRTTSS
jgi:GT2 family glycosyltransferase